MRFALSPYAQSFYVRKIRNRILSDNYKGIAIVSEKNSYEEIYRHRFLHSYFFIVIERSKLHWLLVLIR